jgi:tRNA threonylcarbamoyladenosine biosynthesis protein TsaB
MFRGLMRVLAIDTALEACAAGVFDTAAADPLASESLPIGRGHAEALMPLVARVMDAAAIDFAELDRIAVTIGPGSFTGLRVGISAARGIALATGKPAVGVSTLAAHAAPHRTAGGAHTVVAAIDAHHDLVYFQIFGPDRRGPAAPLLCPVGEAVRAVPPGPVILVGSGAALLAAQWPATLAPPAIDTCRTPELDWIARLGAAADAAHAVPKPLYLRAADARPQDAARLPRR